jgi:hypothetical protein
MNVVSESSYAGTINPFTRIILFSKSLKWDQWDLNLAGKWGQLIALE